MISVLITNQYNETKEFPMYMTEWGNPDFTEEVAAQVHDFVGHDNAWHDMTYAMYDGGQAAETFERDDEYGTPEYSYQVLLNGQTCDNEHLNLFYDNDPELLNKWYQFMATDDSRSFGSNV